MTRTASSASRRTTDRAARAPRPAPARDDARGTPSTVFGVLVVEPAARVPLRALVPVCRHPAGVLEHLREVHEVPGHEGGVAVGEVVLRTATAGVQVRRPGAGLADPPGVGL